MRKPKTVSTADHLFRGRPFTPMLSRDRAVTRLHCYLLLACNDAVVIAASFVMANYLVSLTAPVPIEHGFVMLGAILPLYAIQAGANGTYGAATLDDANLGARRAARALTIAGAVILLIAYMLKASGEFSRGVFALGFAASFVLLILSRKLLQPVIGRILSGSAHTTIVISDAVDYAKQDTEIVLSAEAMGFDPSTSDPHAYSNLAHMIVHADRLVIACTPNRAAIWAPVLRTLAIDAEIITNLHLEVGAIGMRRFGERRTLVINYGPMTFSARVLKRTFDIVFATCATLLLSPILLLTAIMISWESSGPIFFRQERIGRGNRIFRVFKFRSMYRHNTDS